MHRAGTMCEPMLRTKSPSTDTVTSRPKSEVPVGGLGHGSGELEASFEVRRASWLIASKLGIYIYIYIYIYPSF